MSFREVDIFSAKLLHFWTDILKLDPVENSMRRKRNSHTENKNSSSPNRKEFKLSKIQHYSLHFIFMLKVRKIKKLSTSFLYMVSWFATQNDYLSDTNLIVHLEYYCAEITVQQKKRTKQNKNKTKNRNNIGDNLVF